MKTTSYPYKHFGNLVARLRKEAGLPQQSDLANILGKKQQTVSRWEMGLSRPSSEDILVLARALNADVENLLELAGYRPTDAVATFAQPFPVDSLTPENFERFCFYAITELFPETRVHRVGTQGHEQEGADIVATFEDGDEFSFQCKRVSQFGPAEVDMAIKSHSRSAKKKFLLLSRIASPKARQVIQRHSDWDIWDKEDIAKKIRQKLSKDQQLRLVDTFFQGQRLALLGESEPGPWLTSAEFFGPFADRKSAFSHAWDLVGRSQAADALLESLNDDSLRLIWLIGNGGIGKSRLLKHVTEIHQSKDKRLLVRYLAPTEEITIRSLQQLGNTPKLLVVDDAHELDELAPLFQYAAVSTNNVKLLVASRPYGIERLKAQASTFGLAGDCVAEKVINPLTLKETTQLATQVLKEFAGPLSTAEHIARLTSDCQLATVIGARVCATEKIDVELMNNEELFRDAILGKFQNIISGEIGNKSEADAIRRLFRVLALIQPFNSDDAAVAHLVEAAEGLSPPDTNRYIRTLSTAGVLVRRGGLYRLCPDMLTDFIIEKSCVTENDLSTGYAEIVFDAATEVQIKKLLLNLGKLDWRRSNGDPSNSALLDNLWRKFESICSNDQALEALTDVAYYQPNRTLSLVEDLIRTGNNSTVLPRIIRNAAYNWSYLSRACESLWELGKDDPRALNQYPSHPIRILSDLCAVQPNKPLEYNRIAVEFAIQLLALPDSCSHSYTPLDILKGVFQTEGHNIRAEGRNAVFERFSIPPQLVAPLRTAAIDAVISVLSTSDLRSSIAAAKSLAEALSIPTHSAPSSEREWTNIFVQDLMKIEGTVSDKALHPVVFLEIARAVSWHANYGSRDTASIAKRIIALQKSTLEFRTLRSLSDAYGDLEVSGDHKLNREKATEVLQNLADELTAQFPDGYLLWDFVANQFRSLLESAPNRSHSAYTLIWKLASVSTPFCEAILMECLSKVDTIAIQFAGIALAQLWKKDHDYAITLSRRFIDADSVDLKSAVARGLLWSETLNTSRKNEAYDILRTLLTSSHIPVALAAIDVLRTLPSNEFGLLVDFAKLVNFSISKHLADEILCSFDREERIAQLTPGDIDHILNGLMPIRELDGHWIQTFLAHLSKLDPTRTASFFMARVDRSVDLDDFGYRPCNHPPYDHVPLRFRESKHWQKILMMISKWMMSNGDSFFRYRAAQLFVVMFRPIDEPILAFLEAWISKGGPEDMRVISQILKNVENDIVFQYSPFVCNFLTRAKQYGEDVLGEALSALYTSSTSGLRSAPVGEPFPEDLKMKQEAAAMLNKLPRFSPAYKLYDILHKHADGEIKRSIKDQEFFED